MLDFTNSILSTRFKTTCLEWVISCELIVWYGAWACKSRWPSPWWPSPWCSSPWWPSPWWWPSLWWPSLWWLSPWWPSPKQMACRYLNWKINTEKDSPPSIFLPARFWEFYGSRSELFKNLIRDIQDQQIRDEIALTYMFIIADGMTEPLISTSLQGFIDQVRMAESWIWRCKSKW